MNSKVQRLTGRGHGGAFENEIHISADIAYCAWWYAHSTGDTAFMNQYGRELIVEGWVEGPCAEAADLRGGLGAHGGEKRAVAGVERAGEHEVLPHEQAEFVAELQFLARRHVRVVPLGIEAERLERCEAPPDQGGVPGEGEALDAPQPAELHEEGQHLRGGHERAAESLNFLN